MHLQSNVTIYPLIRIKTQNKKIKYKVLILLEQTEHQPIRHQEDNSPGHAGHRPPLHKRVTAEICPAGNLDLQSTMSSAENTNNPWPQVGEEHEYYTPMLVLITSSIVLQVSFPSLLFPFRMNQRSNFFNVLKVLNGLTQVLMGPLNLDKEEFKPFLNIVNYISMFLSYGIVGIDAIKAIFFPQTIFSVKK